MYRIDAEAFRAAVIAGNLQDVTEMLAKGADVEAADALQVRPIHIAADQGHLEILKALVTRGCNVNARASCYIPFSTGTKFERNITPLYLAAGKADPNLALTLISAGADVNAKSSSGTSPLLMATGYGHLSTVKALVAENADVNAEDNTKVTPLFLAVPHNYEHVVEFLVQNGAVVNVRHSNGWTPLHMAAERGNVNIVKLLVQNKAAINEKTREGFTPLHVAVQNRQASVSKFLINNGADLNARDIEGGTPLIYAANSGYPAVETVRLLIAKGADVNAGNKFERTPLYFAADNGFNDVVNILIENKANVNATDHHMFAPLHCAAHEGWLDTTKILIANGADVNARTREQNTALHFAACYWHAEVVKFLLAKGAEVNASDHLNWTPLHYAVEVSSTLVPPIKTGHYGAQPQDSKLNTTKALIENGADVNAKGINHETPLQLAATYGDPEITRCLLENGAYYDVEAPPYLGKITPLKTAILRGNGDVSALLLATEKLFHAVKNAKCVEIEKCIRAGAPVNSRSIKYETPLMYASWKGHSAVVNVLQKNGASTNLSNSNGVTPLHYAAKFGHHEILCLLLQHGAVYNARTKAGRKQPLNFAQEGGKKEVTGTLKLIDHLFISITKNDNTVLKELDKLKNIKKSEFLAIKNCRNTNKETLIQISSKKGYEELCKLFGDL